VLGCEGVGQLSALFLLPLRCVQPRMLMTVDENLKPLSVAVRVGQAVDVVGQGRGARDHHWLPDPHHARAPLCRGPRGAGHRQVSPGPIHRPLVAPTILYNRRGTQLQKPKGLLFFL